MSNAEKIKELFDKGMTQASIARFLKLSRQRVSQIVNGYKTITNKNLKSTVFQRDGNKCQWGKFCENSNLVIHHIDRNSQNNQLDNLITLCKNCHVEWHKELEKDNLKKYICTDCQKEGTYADFSITSKRCFECMEKRKEEERLRMLNKKCTTCSKPIPLKRYNVCWTCKSKKRWENPDFRARHKIAVYNWNKNNPERKKAIDRKAIKKYNSTPKGKLNSRKNSKRFYEALKQNPERYAEYLVAHRESQRKYRAKKRLPVDRIGDTLNIA